jgi:hypothetical protein
MTAPLKPEPLLRALHEAGGAAHHHRRLCGQRAWRDPPVQGSRHRPGSRPANLERPRRVCGLGDLIAMKRAAGRSRDLDDLKRLGVG